MKTLTTKEAKEYGLPTIRYGSRSFVAAQMPREAHRHNDGALYDILLDFLMGRHELRKQPGKDGFWSCIEDTCGECGLVGQVYVATFSCTKEKEVEGAHFFYAVEVK